MATRIIPNQSEGPTQKITVEFDNGDLQALENVVNDWHFLNKESALRFALAILTKARNATVFVTDENESHVPLSPSPNLLRPTEPKQ